MEILRFIGDFQGYAQYYFDGLREMNLYMEQLFDCQAGIRACLVQCFKCFLLMFYEGFVDEYSESKAKNI